MSEFSFRTRKKQMESLGANVFDVAVIGGGITGAALARDAALRGLSVVLLEASDFASGTSSASTKLLHGGLRYLENFEFKLVSEAIHERELLRKLYAPFVKDLHFVFPTYDFLPLPRWKLNCGLFLYDLFARFREPHTNLNRKKTLERYSVLEPTGLNGVCVYTDSFAEDFRLVIELIKSAQERGAQCLNQLAVVHAATKGEEIELTAEDRFEKSQKQRVRARAVFNCTGPFSDDIRSLFGLKPILKLTQGVHFLVKREHLPLHDAFVLPEPEQHRILFAIPWGHVTYFGTTDTSVGSVSEARATAADLHYVLAVVNRFFRIKIRADQVIQSWAGVRPLIKPTEALSNSAISREHTIEEYPQRVFHILGGKLTSHRLMAAQALDLGKKYLNGSPCTTQKVPLLSTPTLPVDTDTNLLEAVRTSILHEMALEPIDFLKRRSRVFYETNYHDSADIERLKAIHSVFTEEMKWTPDQASKAFEKTLSIYRWNRDGF